MTAPAARTEAGFTLVEMMIAIIVLTSVFLGVGAVLNSRELDAKPGRNPGRGQRQPADHQPGAQVGHPRQGRV